MGTTYLRQRSRAFTLIELLVVMGIVVVLAGLLIPAVVRSYKTARRTRTSADFQLIGTALEAYKSDFGDYPRFDNSNANDATTAGFSADPINIQEDRGALLLCRALLAPGQASMQGGTAVTLLGFNAASGEQAPDGNDGPGFRTRPGGAGTVYGPYIQSDKFKLGNPGASGGLLGAPSLPGKWDSTYFTDATLLDSWGDPILYYPATRGNITTTGVNGSFVCSFSNGAPTGNGATPTVVPLYNGLDNEGYGESPNTPTTYFLDSAQLQYLLGDRDMDGYLAAGRTAVTTQPYLLWSAGPDGHYGFGTTSSGTPVVPTNPPTPSMRTDDITNFDLPADLSIK